MEPVRAPDNSGRFSAMFYVGNKIWDSLFSFQHIKPGGSTLKEKNLLPIQKGGKNNFDSVATIDNFGRVATINSPYTDGNDKNAIKCMDFF